MRGLKTILMSRRDDKDTPADEEIEARKKAESALRAAYFDINYGCFYNQMSYRYHFQKSEFARLNARNTAWSWRNRALLEYLSEDDGRTVLPVESGDKVGGDDFYDPSHTLRQNGPAMPMSLRGAVITDAIVEATQEELAIDRPAKHMDFYRFDGEDYSIEMTAIDFSTIVDASDRMVMKALRDRDIKAGKVGVFSVRTPVYEALFAALNPAASVSYIGPLVNVYEVVGGRIGNAGAADGYDLIFCDSVIASYGFGRYHESEDQVAGDLRLINELAEQLTPDGVMLVLLPVCDDYLIPNVGRLYGSRRIARLFDNFDTIFSADISRRDFFDRCFQMKEVLFCLKRRVPASVGTNEVA